MTPSRWCAAVLPLIALSLSPTALSQADFWIPAGNLAGAQVYSIFFTQDGYPLVGTANMGSYISQDGGQTWTKISDYAFFCASLNVFGALEAGTEGHGLLRSTDRGMTWIQGTPSSGNVYSLLNYRFKGACDELPADAHFVGTDSQAVFGNAPAFGFSVHQGLGFFAGTYGNGVYYTVDVAGSSWSPQNNGLLNLYVQAIAVDARANLFAGTDDGVFVSTDRGANWTKLSKPWHGKVHRLALNQRNWLYAATEGGVYCTRDQGATWIEANGGLTNLNTGALAVAPDGQVWVGTWGSGVFRSSKTTETPPLVTSIVPASARGGATVRVYGKDFIGPAALNQVFFSGVRGEVLDVSDTFLDVVVPMGAILGPLEVVSAGLSCYSSTMFTPIPSALYRIDSTSFIPVNDLAVVNSVTSEPQSVWVVDLDTDAKPDLVTIAGPECYYALNVSSGALLDSTSFSGASFGREPVGFAFAELDGDSRLDLLQSVAWTPVSPHFRLLLNRSSPSTFSYSTYASCRPGYSPSYFVDANGNGKPDLLGRGEGSTALYRLAVWERHFSPSGIDATLKAQGDSAFPPTFSAGDLIGDSRSEFVLLESTPSSRAVVYSNAGIGDEVTYTPVATIDIAGLPNLVRLGDMNGDRSTDLVIASSGSPGEHRVAVFPNLSSLTAPYFGSPSSLPLGSPPSSLALADMSGDGRPDILLSISGVAALFIYPNVSSPGTIAFAPPVRIPLPGEPSSVNVADFDVDGRPDLLIAYANKIAVARNRSSVDVEPGFWTSLQGPAGGQVMCVAVDHRRRLFAGTFNAGLNRSTNGGASWETTDFRTFQSLAVGHEGVLIGGTDGSGIVRSTDNGTTWQSANSGISESNVPALAMDRQGNLYAGSWDGGIYRSTNNGQSWTSVFTIPGIPVFAFAFESGGLAYAGSYGSGVYLSTDNGSTWSTANAGLSNRYVQSLAMDRAGTLYAGTDGGVFRSTDNGSSWTLISSAWSAVVHRMLVSENGTLYAGTSKGLYWSHDGGNSWTLENSGLTHTDIGAAIFDLEGHLFTGTWGGGTYRSAAPLAFTPLPGEYAADAGTVGLWHMNEAGSMLAADASGKMNHGTSTGAGVAGGRTGEARHFTGPNGRVEIPHTASMDWTSTRRLTFEAWVYLTSYQRQALGHKGEAATSPYSAEWTVVLESDSTLEFTVNADASNSVRSVLSATRKIELQTWTHVACVWDGSGNVIRIYLNGVLAGATSAIGSMVSLSDKPLTLGFVGNGPCTGMMDEVRVSDVVRDPGEFILQLPPRNLAAATGTRSIALSWQNGGGLSGLLRYKIFRGLDSLAVAPLDSTMLTTYADSSVGPGQSYFYRVAALDSLGFMSLPSSAATATLPGAVPGPVPLVYPANNATVNSAVVAFVWARPAGTVTGYWFDIATDSLFVFHNIDSTLTDTSKVATGLLHNERYWWRVRARNASGWGMFSEKRTLNVVISGVEDMAEIPDRFTLYPNYPNPFNPSTTMRYGIPVKSQVRLTVFNTLGQRVATLVEGEKEAGYHEAGFDASSLSSGVYIVRMQAGEFVESRKLLLLR